MEEKTPYDKRTLRTRYNVLRQSSVDSERLWRRKTYRSRREENKRDKREKFRRGVLSTNRLSGGLVTPCTVKMRHPESKDWTFYYPNVTFKRRSNLDVTK